MSQLVREIDGTVESSRYLHVELSGEGLASRVRVYSGKSVTASGEPSSFQDLDPFGQVLPGGVFVG